jgi:hypothetical protein
VLVCEELEAGENEHRDQLREGKDAQPGEQRAQGAEREQDEWHRQHELESGAVGENPGKHGWQEVVEHTRHRVGQVEEIRERPDPTVEKRGTPSGRGLHEGAQPTPGDDPIRVGEPDPERDREDTKREQDNQPGRPDRPALLR